ncbi:MG(2+) CHELATASE FAMILY PROTEIN / ComM-related protein [Alloactinosynnema sp. L-07]|uniref:ATP-binding protein n=1 Tax=Alloactinosynnema sp. L-07 TaxID=1653480 RepID=UPI00065F0068|nr:ATP-binding protein [Alloactinosynnema sp. L-07]CRK59198.1 MG(2+) CHELATASE FAMILY PROTEIN / ComM-related protein [Alloactinosynnema sp. L-07]
MPIAAAWSAGLIGVDSVPVPVAAAISDGPPTTTTVGNSAAVPQETKDRIRAAVRNSRVRWPDTTVVLEVSSAATTADPAFDLALAVAVLVADGEVPPHRVAEAALIGELAFDGKLRSVRGVLPRLLAVRRSGLRRAVVPTDALGEAALVPDLEVRGATSLNEVLGWLRGDGDVLAVPDIATRNGPADPPDLANVVGQAEARRALEVAAAGGHHVLLVGPVGSGKTTLAKSLAGILPPLTVEQALESAAIHSAARSLTDNPALATVPPFSAPHHTISVPALVGGGAGLARPGAISAAHHGILFLDNVCEFATNRLEAVRAALYQGEIRLTRRDMTVRFPARFQLVLACVQMVTDRSYSRLHLPGVLASTQLPLFILDGYHPPTYPRAIPETYRTLKTPQRQSGPPAWHACQAARWRGR